MEYAPPVNGNLADPDRPYINANPGVGQQGSIPPAEAIEHPQREILEVIEQAGITPDGGDLTQLYDAIALLIAAVGTVPDASTTVKGKVELTTGAEALGGSDTTRAVTSAALASSKSLSANGYMVLPGGLIIQWGKTPSGFGQTVTFPLAFPTACCAVVGCPDDSGISHAATVTVSSVTQTQCLFNQYRVDVFGNDSHPVHWLAFGY